MRTLLALAFAPLLAWGSPVVEYYNTGLGHYFMTADPGEMNFIAAGGAGPGWVRSGFSFETQGSCVSSSGGPCTAKPVCRFYGTVGIGPNSHFYTADEDECSFVREHDPGWTFEAIAFTAYVPEPGTGRCPAMLHPIYRTYNDRSRYNDSNHRYAVAEATQWRMIGRGWLDEGIVFCATEVRDEPLRSFVLSADAARVRGGADCAAHVYDLRTCIAFNNLADPAFTLGPYAAGDKDARLFAERAGSPAGRVFSISGPSASQAAASAFVQVVDATHFGIHVDTASRGSFPLSSVNPLYQFLLFPGDPDERFAPWSIAYDTDVEIAISFDLRLKRLGVGAGSHGYGHPTLDILDTRSSKHFYFTVLTYGNVAPDDLLMRDVASGTVIVGTVFRPWIFGSFFVPAPLYGRNFGRNMIATGPDFSTSAPEGDGGHFEFRIGRDEFQRILAAARTLEPSLSADPADYLFDDFHFNNEVAGDGEIGVSLGAMRVDLLRREFGGI